MSVPYLQGIIEHAMLRRLGQGSQSAEALDRLKEANVRGQALRMSTPFRFQTMPPSLTTMPPLSTTFQRTCKRQLPAILYDNHKSVTLACLYSVREVSAFPGKSPIRFYTRLCQDHHLPHSRTTPSPSAASDIPVLARNYSSVRSHKPSMDIELYVYDLSQGLARQMSLAFLGVQIDAVYHTSLVFGGIEYMFGAGVQTCYPGATHHGQPFQKIKLGRTELPLEVILEYLETLKQTYTPESYDLFAHNCNNFTNDFAMFLVGKGIPAHITSLPETVLQTPFGQMLRPQLDRAMRSVTQAPVASPMAVNVQGNVVRSAMSQAAANGYRAPATPQQTSSHPHASLPLPIFKKLPTTPRTFTNIPPLAKLTAKMGDQANSPAIKEAVAFLETRQSAGAAEAPLPNLSAIGIFLRSSLTKLPAGLLFTTYDLLRCLLIDPRVSGFFAEEQGLSTIATLVMHARDVSKEGEGAYQLRLVATQLACNLFTSPLMVSSALGHGDVPAVLVELATTGLLSQKYPNLRLAAAGLAMNIATTTNEALVAKAGFDANGNGVAPHVLKPASLEQGLAVELAASLAEAVAEETGVEAARLMALALGRLVYCKQKDEVEDVFELCQAMEVAAAVAAKAEMEGTGRDDKMLMREIGKLLGRAL